MNEGFYLIKDPTELGDHGTEPGWTPTGGCYGGVACQNCVLGNTYENGCNYDLEKLQLGLPKGTAYFKVTDYPELFI